MTCETIGGAILCSSTVYEYRGWRFEYHRHLGPVPLKKNGDLRHRVPDRFWDDLTSFEALTRDRQQAFRVER